MEKPAKTGKKIPGPCDLVRVRNRREVVTVAGIEPGSEGYVVRSTIARYPWALAEVCR